SLYISIVINTTIIESLLSLRIISIIFAILPPIDDVKKTAAMLLAAEFSTGAYKNLGDFGNFDCGLVLAVSVHFVYSLLRLVANSGNFVGLDIGFDDLGRDLGFVDGWRTNADGLAVNNEQRLKGSC